MSALIDKEDSHIEVSSKTIIYVTITCLLVMVLEGFDIQALGVAAPILFPILKFDPSQVGWIFSAGQAGVVVGAMIGGLISDKIGRRNVLLLAVPIFGIFTLAIVATKDFGALLAIRFLAGFGLGAAMTNVIGLAVDVAKPEHRVKTVALILAGMPTGGMTVSILAKMYLSTMGWQFLFYVGGIIPVLLFFMLLKLPNPKTHHEKQDTDMMKALFGEGRATSTILLWVVFFFTSSVLYMLLNWLPTLMKERGFGIGVATSSSLIFNLSSIIGSIILGILIDKKGYKNLLPAAYVGVLGGIIWLAYSMGANAALSAIALLGLFLLGAQYSLSGISPMYYPKAVRGVGTGASIAIGRVGSITGPLMAGFILKATNNPTSVAIAMIPLVAIAAIAAAILTRKAVILDN